LEIQARTNAPGATSTSLKNKIDGVSPNNAIIRDKEDRASEKAKMHPHIATAIAARTKQEQLLKATQGKQRVAAPIAYKEHLLKLAHRRGVEILKLSRRLANFALQLGILRRR